MSDGMNAGDFRPCAFCGKGVMHTRLPLFWRVSIERMGVDVSKVRQLAGLEMMMGHAGLARTMGDDSDLAKPLHDAPITLLVCEDCGVNHSLPVAAFAEHAK